MIAALALGAGLLMVLLPPALQDQFGLSSLMVISLINLGTILAILSGFFALMQRIDLSDRQRDRQHKALFEKMTTIQRSVTSTQSSLRTRQVGGARGQVWVGGDDGDDDSAGSGEESG